MASLSVTDPLLSRAGELLQKHLPLAPTLWLKPPGDTPFHHQESRFWHPWNPEHQRLISSGWSSLEKPQTWTQAALFGGKQKEENRQLLAHARAQVGPQGSVYMVVANDYGAKSFQKEVEGLQAHHSGRKSRLFILSGDDNTTPLYTLGPNKTGLQSCPGLFSWEKADQGSKVLAEALKELQLSGPVADLGAGWGYLSLGLDPKLTLHLMEADLRGIEACKENLKDRNAHFHWCDLSSPEGIPHQLQGNMSTVITNPPFHTNRKSDPVLGGAFVATASKLLRRRGSLYLVGNVHLPYQRIMKSFFDEVTVLLSKDGFNVLQGVKK